MYLIIIIFICLMFPVIPFLFKNIHNVLFYGVRDIFNYIRYKKYNECHDFGKVVTICGSGVKVFGSGKTLTGVHTVRHIYNRYNGKKVWNPYKKEFVTQHIHIISNVELKDIPFVWFDSENQLVEVEQDEMDVTIFLLDESGSIWNSRNYKDNISTDLLTALLQCRHNKIGLITTSQRFIFQDKLIREITSEVWAARKYWRLQRLQCFDAYDLENCSNPALVKPLKTSYWFVKNKDYNAYDTRAIVDRLKKMSANNELLSQKEILENQGDTSADNVASVTRLSRRGRKRL